MCESSELQDGDRSEISPLALERAAAKFRGIYIWDPYEHHRNSVWLILQWKRAAEMVCHLFWSVARKAQHICSLVWASSHGWMAGREPLKEHQEHWSRTCRRRGWSRIEGNVTGKKTSCCLPFSPPSSSLISALFPLFAVFPLINFVFCHKLILSLTWTKI